MKNNRGFTLVELLATIVLLAVIMTIAVPSVMNLSRNTKEKMLETKLDLILEDAKLYGQDHLNELAVQTTKFQSYPCQTINIEQLLTTGYLTRDKEDNEVGYIVNPVDNSSLNNKNIILYLKNKRVVTILTDADNNGIDENSCS